MKETIEQKLQRFRREAKEKVRGCISQEPVQLPPEVDVTQIVSDLQQHMKSVVENISSVASRTYVDNILIKLQDVASVVMNDNRYQKNINKIVGVDNQMIIYPDNCKLLVVNSEAAV
jgi:hypothetical protein